MSDFSGRAVKLQRVFRPAPVINALAPSPFQHRHYRRTLAATKSGVVETDSRLQIARPIGLGSIRQWIGVSEFL